MNVSRPVALVLMAAGLAVAPARSLASISTVADLPEGATLVLKRSLPVGQKPDPQEGVPSWVANMNQTATFDIVGGRVLGDDEGPDGDYCTLHVSYPEGKKRVPGNRIAAGTKLEITRAEHVDTADALGLSRFEFVTLHLAHPLVRELSCQSKDAGPLPIDRFNRTIQGVLELQLPSR